MIVWIIKNDWSAALGNAMAAKRTVSASCRIFITVNEQCVWICSMEAPGSKRKPSLILIVLVALLTMALVAALGYGAFRYFDDRSTPSSAPSPSTPSPSPSHHSTNVPHHYNHPPPQLLVPPRPAPPTPPQPPTPPAPTPPAPSPPSPNAKPGICLNFESGNVNFSGAPSCADAQLKSKTGAGFITNLPQGTTVMPQMGSLGPDQSCDCIKTGPGAPTGIAYCNAINGPNDVVQKIVNYGCSGGL